MVEGWGEGGGGLDIHAIQRDSKPNVNRPNKII